MTSPAFSATRESEVESLLAGELAAADRSLADIQKTLRHRIGSEDDALLSDRIVAEVRGQIDDLVRQIATDEAGHEALVDKLTADPALVRHIHVLALETQLAERLSERLALDPVVSPLVRALMPDSAATKDFVAAQARFVQRQRRGELTLAELPGELQDALPGGSEPAGAGNRLDLLEAVAVGLDDLTAALDVAQAGVALFATALARAVGITRETALLAMSQSRAPRLALALRAAGLGASAVERQLFAFDPDGAPPEGLATLSPERAAALLAGGR